MERAEYALMSRLEGSLWWYRALHADVVDLLRAMRLPAQARLLDAGCGTGGLLHSVADAFPGFHLTGLEFDAEAAGMARGKSRATIVNGNIAAMPFADAQFDAIVSTDVLYHRNVDEQAALGECRRCLVPGGSLLLSLPAYEWMRSSHDEHVHGARRYTASSLRQRVEAAGLRVELIGYRNSLLFPLMLLHRLTTGRHKTESDVEMPAAWINRLFYTVTSIERRLARIGLRLPFGGSVWVWAKKP